MREERALLRARLGLTERDGDAGDAQGEEEHERDDQDPEALAGPNRRGVDDGRGVREPRGNLLRVRELGLRDVVVVADDERRRLVWRALAGLGESQLGDRRLGKEEVREAPSGDRHLDEPDG